VAEGNGTGVVGVAPGCALVAVRFPLSMSDAHFIVMFKKISDRGTGHLGGPLAWVRFRRWPRDHRADRVGTSAPPHQRPPPR